MRQNGQGIELKSLPTSPVIDRSISGTCLALVPHPLIGPACKVMLISAL